MVKIFLFSGPSFKGYIDIIQSVKIPRCDLPSLPAEKPYEIPSNLKQRYIPYGSRMYFFLSVINFFFFFVLKQNFANK